MLKKAMLLMAAIAALTALVPALANASARNFTHNGATLNAAKTVKVHGDTTFVSSAGGLTCETTADVHLGPGSTGTVTSFDPTATSSPTCTYSNGLTNLCGHGPLTVHQSTKLPWTIHATKYSGGQYGITVTDIEVHVDGTGAFCPNVTITGDVILTGDPHDGSLLHLENGPDLKSHNLGASIEAHGTQKVIIGGVQSGTYKVET